MNEQQSAIFYTGMYGEIHKNEAVRWYNSLRRFAEERRRPVIALVDLNAVTFIGGTARVQLADVTRLPCLKSLIFISTQPHILQAIRMIGMLGERGTTYAFPNRTEAADFARREWGVDFETAKA
ncbi:MAG: hypothetical protein IAE80_26270 [Anaerolinea sp.]|nr:hypothetical protein [Anaerolinea sp.]